MTEPNSEEEQEWWKIRNGKQVFLCIGSSQPYEVFEMSERIIDQILADHAAARNARRLEEMLGKYVVAMHTLQHANDVEWQTCEQGMCPKAAALLLSSPAVATEDKGGEGK